MLGLYQLLALVAGGVSMDLQSWAGPLVLVALIIVVGYFAVLPYVRTWEWLPRQRWVRRHGQRAEATVLDVRARSGIFDRGRYAEVELVLRIEPEDRPPYELRTRRLVSTDSLRTYQPGMQLRVRVHQRFPTTVVF